MKDEREIIKHITRKFFTKIAIIQTIIILVFYVILISTSHFYFKKYIHQQAKQQLSNELFLLKKMAEQHPSNTFCSFHKSTRERITLIDWNGAVLCDSEHDSGTMENHLNRPEVLEAKLHPSLIGFSIRESKTLGTNMLYGAISLSSAKRPLILRIATHLQELEKAIAVFDVAMMLIFIPFVFFGSLLILWLFYRFSKPMRIAFSKMYEISKKTNLTANRPTQWHENSNQDGWEIIHQILEDSDKNLENTSNQIKNDHAKFNALLDATEDCIVATDQHSSITFANKKFQDIFCHGKIHPAKIGDLIRNPKVTTAFDLKKAITLHDLYLQKRYFDLIITPIPFGLLGVFHDVSERKKMEQIKMDLISNFSHEVRTPLAGAQGLLQLLHQETSKEKMTNYVDRALVNLKKITRLSDNLLELSRIENTNKLMIEECSTAKLSSDAVVLISHLAESKKITIKTEVRLGAEKVLGDPFLIEQILVNLLENACKYTPDQGKIEIYWSKATAEVVLEIRDNGIGVPRELHERIFERFYQADPSRSQGGAGLGLAIVKHIVHKHGGRIGLKSESGKGSIFKIFLPVFHSKE